MNDCLIYLAYSLLASWHPWLYSISLSLSDLTTSSSRGLAVSITPPTAAQLLHLPSLTDLAYSQYLKYGVFFGRGFKNTDHHQRPPTLEVRI